MNIPDDLRYTAEHEWVRIDGTTATVGITDYAQDALGDVVFVQMPAVGSTVSMDATVGEIESTKSVSDVFAPVSGVVLTLNTALDSDPSVVNSDPYGAGWFFTIEMSDPGAFNSLLDSSAYRSLTE